MAIEQEQHSDLSITADGVIVVLPNGDGAQLRLTKELLEDPKLSLAWAQLVVSHQMVVQQASMAQSLTQLADAISKLSNPEVNRDRQQRLMQDSMDMAFGMVERMLPGMDLKSMMKLTRPNGG